MHKNDPLLYFFHISRFHSVTSNSKSFSPAATLDPRPRLWTRDPRPATISQTLSNPILRLSRQNEATWASFHRRVSGIHYNYDQLFPETVFQFLEAKAKSVGSSIGYLVPSLMTATSFLLGNTDAHFLNGNHIQPLNLYTMSVGHPGTGKSPAIETVLAALRDIDTISKETLVSATTSSGLVKTISKQLR